MVGIDIIEVKRIEESIQNANFLAKILTYNEIEYVSQFANKCAHVAGLFCAKEAVMKALEDCKQISFKDIEIAHKNSGKPYVILNGKALEVFNKSGKQNIEISISQTNTVATAICIIS